MVKYKVERNIGKPARSVTYKPPNIDIEKNESPASRPSREAMKVVLYFVYSPLARAETELEEEVFQIKRCVAELASDSALLVKCFFSREGNIAEIAEEIGINPSVAVDVFSGAIEAIIEKVSWEAVKRVKNTADRAQKLISGEVMLPKRRKAQVASYVLSCNKPEVMTRSELRRALHSMPGMWRRILQAIHQKGGRGCDSLAKSFGLNAKEAKAVSTKSFLCFIEHIRPKHEKAYRKIEKA